MQLNSSGTNSLPYRLAKSLGAMLGLVCVALIPVSAQAGAQAYEQLSASVRARLQKAISDKPVTADAFESDRQAHAWLDTMSKRLEKRIPLQSERDDLVRSVLYESRRAGLDPELVLGVIQVESNFRKYAVSTAGAMGYTQVMPFWVKEIGTTGQSLFLIRNNLRFGCVILRHYLDMERGDLFRALGRYNGSLGQPEYPNLVLAAWKNSWTYAVQRAESSSTQSRPIKSTRY
jgi:soluble lytic murein transglycosylase-like protein